MVIQEGIYDRFLEDVVQTVSNLRVGSPFDDDVDVGAVTMKNQVRQEFILTRSQLFNNLWTMLAQKVPLFIVEESLILINFILR